MAEFLQVWLKRSVAVALAGGVAAALSVGVLRWQFPGRYFRIVEAVAIHVPTSSCPSPDPAGGPLRVIAHAGGAVAGRTYTNSLEAMDRSFADGCRFFEIDLEWTSDGALVGLHDWNANAAKAFGSDFAGRWHSLDETLAAVRVDGLTTIDEETLARWSTAHPTARIVTDVKWDNVKALQRLARLVPEAEERVIPQIYDYDEYDPVVALGYSEIVLTLYRIESGDDEVVDFVRASGLYAVAMPAPRAFTPLPGRLRDEGVAVWVHTVNSTGHATTLRARGVTGIFTDHLCRCGGDPPISGGRG